MPLRVLFLALLLVPGLASATTVSYVGSLDPTNANAVYLLPFTLTGVSDVIVQSFGYGGTAGAPGGTNAAGNIIAAGGFDTYLSLFRGTGASATFVASNDDGGCGPASPNPICEDSRLSLTGLAAGGYTLALTLPGNFSFAENYGSGTLGDGFIGLQGDYYDSGSGKVRTSNFAFDLTSTPSTTPPSTVPEPSTLLLLCTGVGAALAPLRLRMR